MTNTSELIQEFCGRVQPFIGHWKGTGEVLPNPWGYSGTTRGEWQFCLAVGQRHLLADYREERHDGSAFEGHGVMMPDQESREILWFWFDSYGYPAIPAARGTYGESGFIFAKITPRGHGRTALSVADGCLRHEAAFKPHDAPDFMVVARGRYYRNHESDGLRS